MIEKLKDINPSLPGMLLVELIYLVLGEIIVILFVPWKLSCGIGLLAGVIYAFFSSIHLSLRIRKVVYGGANTTKTLVLGYLIRVLVMLIVFAVLYFFRIGNLVCAIIGMFSMKVAAYMGPFTDRLFLDKGKVSEDDSPPEKNFIEKESE